MPSTNSLATQVEKETFFVMNDEKVKLMGNNPPPSLLRKLILEDLKEPMIFRGLISDWKCLSWSLQDWSDKLGDKLMPFRSGVKKVTSVPQWERNCQMTHLTMKEFIELSEKNGTACSSCSNWFYFDYKYMHEWFQDNPDIIKDVSWESLGFPEVKGEESTLWIGSDGAHTPCHFDTYGSNLVGQVYGLKQWILFPPSARESLLPARVPYEESSVYSKHNFYAPDSQVINGLHKAWIIDLKPGDVLFVPHHWWHYVENVGTAISINTWLPLPSDAESRLEEALVKLLVAQLSKEVPDARFILNPNEEDMFNTPLFKSTALLDACMRQFYEEQLNREQQHAEGSTLQPKRMKISAEDSETCSEIVNNTLSTFRTYIHPIPTYSGEKLSQLLTAKRTRFKSALAETEDQNVPGVTSTLEKVINAVCHPDVISVVKTKLCQEFCGNS